MNQFNIEDDKIRFSSLLIPTWSRQHGAYISLITSWLIGTLLSESLSRTHAVVIVFLLAGLNLGELVQEYLKKKFAVTIRKKMWIVLYGFLAAASGYNLLKGAVTFSVIFPVLAAVSVVYIYLSLKREHKHVLSELLAFASIAMAGLIAFNPDQAPGLEFLKLWVLLFCYFGSSVFLVKARFDKVSFKEILSYLVFCLLLTVFLIDISIAVISVLLLIITKLLVVVLAIDWYKRLPIAKIGFMEFGYCFVLVTVLLIAH